MPFLYPALAKKSKMSFALWMAKVNAALEAKCGLSSSDLPDYCYKDAYDNGKSPAGAASAALKAAKEF